MLLYRKNDFLINIDEKKMLGAIHKVRTQVGGGGHAKSVQGEGVKPCEYVRSSTVSAKNNFSNIGTFIAYVLYGWTLRHLYLLVKIGIFPIKIKNTLENYVCKLYGYKNSNINEARFEISIQNHAYKNQIIDLSITSHM